MPILGLVLKTLGVLPTAASEKVVYLVKLVMAVVHYLMVRIDKRENAFSSSTAR